MKKKNVLLIISILLIIALIIFRNIMKEKDIDTLITQNPCAPPCWYGIQPGMTSEQVMPKLQEINIINQNEIKESSYEQNGDLVKFLYYKCTNKNKNERCGGVTIRNEIVESIFVSPSGTIEIGQVVEIYGSPDKYSVDWVAPNSACHIGFYWTKFELYAYYQNNMRWECKQALNKNGIERSLKLSGYFYIYNMKIEEFYNYNPQDWGGFIY